MNQISKGREMKTDLLRERKRVDKPGILPSGHDISRLDEAAEGLQRILEELKVDQKVVAEWHHRWGGNGWTTPAEHFLVEKALGNALKQATQLHDVIVDLNEGIGRVGPL